MRRIILAALFCLVGITGAFAQIQNKILGVELGSTNEKEMVEILKSKQIICKRDAKDGSYSATNVTFSNVKWKEAGFLVADNVVSGVMFIDDNENNATEMAIIKKALKTKYEEYLVQDMAGMISIYNDEKVALVFLNRDNKTALVYVLVDYIQQILGKFMNEL